MKKGDVEIECPHCGEEMTINPASIMAKRSAKVRDTSTERMRAVAMARWDKVAKTKKQ